MGREVDFLDYCIWYQVTHPNPGQVCTVTLTRYQTLESPKATSTLKFQRGRAPPGMERKKTPRNRRFSSMFVASKKNLKMPSGGGDSIRSLESRHLVRYMYRYMQRPGGRGGSIRHRMLKKVYLVPHTWSIRGLGDGNEWWNMDGVWSMLEPLILYSYKQQVRIHSSLIFLHLFGQVKNNGNRELYHPPSHLTHPFRIQYLTLHGHNPPATAALSKLGTCIWRYLRGGEESMFSRRGMWANFGLQAVAFHNCQRRGLSTLLFSCNVLYITRLTTFEGNTPEVDMWK